LDHTGTIRLGAAKERIFRDPNEYINNDILARLFLHLIN
jgi:hypothetical protein